MNKEEIINITELFLNNKEEKLRKDKEEEEDDIEEIIYNLNKILEELENKNQSVNIEVFIVDEGIVYLRKESKIFESNYTSYENGKYARIKTICKKSLFQSVKNRIENNFYKVIRTKNDMLICTIKLK